MSSSRTGADGVEPRVGWPATTGLAGPTLTGTAPSTPVLPEIGVPFMKSNVTQRRSPSVDDADADPVVVARRCWRSDRTTRRRRPGAPRRRRPRRCSRRPWCQFGSMALSVGPRSGRWHSDGPVAVGRCRRDRSPDRRWPANTAAMWVDHARATPSRPRRGPAAGAACVGPGLVRQHQEPGFGRCRGRAAAVADAVVRTTPTAATRHGHGREP